MRSDPKGGLPPLALLFYTGIMEVIFEDNALLAINKPAGLLSAPDRYDPNAAVAAVELENTYGRLWPLHRLDLDTSGCLIFARNAESHRALSLDFEYGRVSKTYHAVVKGRPAWEEAESDLPLRPDGDRRHRTVIDATGKDARTRFRLLGRHGDYSLIEAIPLTGRTHQIRVHLSALGFPVVCDPLYGDDEPLFLSRIKKKWKGDHFEERPLIFRTALHAVSIEFIHPEKSERIKLGADYPKDMKALIKQLQKVY